MSSTWTQTAGLDHLVSGNCQHHETRTVLLQWERNCTCLVGILEISIYQICTPSMSKISHGNALRHVVARRQVYAATQLVQLGRKYISLGATMGVGDQMLCLFLIYLGAVQSTVLRWVTGEKAGSNDSTRVVCIILALNWWSGAILLCRESAYWGQRIPHV